MIARMTRSATREGTADPRHERCGHRCILDSCLPFSRQVLTNNFALAGEFEFRAKNSVRPPSAAESGKLGRYDRLLQPVRAPRRGPIASISQNQQTRAMRPPRFAKTSCQSAVRPLRVAGMRNGGRCDRLPIAETSFKSAVLRSNLPDSASQGRSPPIGCEKELRMGGRTASILRNGHRRALRPQQVAQFGFGMAVVPPQFTGAGINERRDRRNWPNWVSPGGLAARSRLNQDCLKQMLAQPARDSRKDSTRRARTPSRSAAPRPALRLRTATCVPS